MIDWNFNNGDGIDVLIDRIFNDYLPHNNTLNNYPMVWNGECGPGYKPNAQRTGCVPIDEILNPIDCPENFYNVDGVCWPIKPNSGNCNCLTGTPYILDNGGCGCHDEGGGIKAVPPNLGPLTIGPGGVISHAPLTDVSNQLKTFYANNKTLSLVVLAGAAFLLFKGK